MTDYKTVINIPENIRNYFRKRWENMRMMGSKVKWSDYISGLTVAFLRSIKIAEEHKE